MKRETFRPDVDSRLQRRRAADDKDKVVIGCMIFISIVMVLLFVHGVARNDAREFRVLFVLRCLGYFVGLSLPLLIWNSYRYVRYINKRRHEADFYVLKDVVGSDYEDHDFNEEPSVASDYDKTANDNDYGDYVAQDFVNSGGKVPTSNEDILIDCGLSDLGASVINEGEKREKFSDFSQKVGRAFTQVMA